MLKATSHYFIRFHSWAVLTEGKTLSFYSFEAHYVIHARLHWALLSPIESALYQPTGKHNHKGGLKISQLFLPDSKKIKLMLLYQSLWLFTFFPWNKKTPMVKSDNSIWTQHFSWNPFRTEGYNSHQQLSHLCQIVYSILEKHLRFHTFWYLIIIVNPDKSNQ